MKKIGVVVLGAMWIAGGTAPASAASVGGTSGAEILAIPVGARAIAMGEAYTAMADDVSSLYWNPAGIAILNQSEASFMYSQWLKDLTYNQASIATPLEHGGIGASVSYLSYGTIDGFDNQGNPQGSVNAYSGVATVGGGFFSDLWAVGMNVKGIQGKLADVKANGFAADLGGTVVYPKEIKGGSLRGAFTLRNVGPGMKYISQSDPLPTELRVGLAAVQMLDKKLNLSVDYGRQRDLDGGLYAGAEYWLMSHIALRAGYAGSHTESNGMRAGLGLKLGDLAFNYAYSPFGDLGMTHRYELSMKFGAIRPSMNPEIWKMYRQAKTAMAQERYGEATMLSDSLIQMMPKYKPFRRLATAAMTGYEKQEDQAKFSGKVNLHGKSRTIPEDKSEQAELEALLNMADGNPTTAKVKTGGRAGGSD